MQWIFFVRTVSIKKTKTVQKKKPISTVWTEDPYYSLIPRHFLSITPITWQQHLKSQHILKQRCVHPPVGPKVLATFKKLMTLAFFLFLFLICKVPFHLPLSHGQHQVASDWLIRVIPLNAKREGEKKHPLFFSNREANSTKYGVAYGLRPLGRLRPLTVRCVFYVMGRAFFFFIPRC